jgi:hypothetical protein
VGCRTPGGRNGQEAGEGGRWEMETFKVNLTPILISLSTSHHLDLQPFPIQIILRVAFDRPVLMKAHLIVRTKHPFKHTPELLYEWWWLGGKNGWASWETTDSPFPHLCCSLWPMASCVSLPGQVCPLPLHNHAQSPQVRGGPGRGLSH